MNHTEPSPTVAIQGAPGAYSELAARELLTAADVHPMHALPDVFDAVTSHRVRFAAIPLENTIAGTVPGAYELLLTNDLRIVAERSVAIDHALIAPPGVELSAVRRVLSHPVALGQCRRFLDAHPRIEPVAAFDTAGAVGIVMREADGVSAAIAGRHAAPVYGAEVLAEHLQDHGENWTRFGLIARPDDPHRSGDPTKVSLVCDLRHQPGALAAVLQPAARRTVNLTKIESRPIPTSPFEYRFIVELESDDPARLAQVVTEMSALTAALRVLGTYTAAHPE